MVVLYFLLQFPFLNSDPDILVDPDVRNAWTDEGVYSSQVRNFVNHGNFSISENSTFVRGPLYNLIQLPFFYVFGTKLLVGRLITLIFTLLVIYLFLREKRLQLFGLFLIVFSLLEFHLFQFAHYSMAEMMCIDFILLSMYFLNKILDINYMRNNIRMVFWSSLFMLLSYSAKIQFLYAAAIVPLTLLCFAVKDTFKQKTMLFSHYYLFFWSLALMVFFAAFYYFTWFLPNERFYVYVMTSESSGRFASTINDLKGSVVFNIRNLWRINDFKVIISHFLILLVITFTIFIPFRKKILCPTLLVFSFIWILIEMHKLPMLYFPNRYLVSLLFAIGIFVSAIYSEIIVSFRKLKYLIYSLVVAFGVYSLLFDYAAFKRRTNQLEMINNYMARTSLNDRTVIGPWSSSFCWQNKAITFPVWNNYFNWKDPVKNYKPGCVVTETDESDSDGAYKTQGIQLIDLSDSMRVFDIWKTKVAIYWIKPALIK